MESETLGAHLRNLLTPYKNLLQLVKDGKADEETIRKYNLDNLNDLIAFSNSEAMEQKHSQEPASDDLEQAAEQAEQREGNLINGRFKAGFKSGAQWQREQMMKNSMECHIDYYDGPNLDFTQKQLDDALEKNGAKVGDKVKVIIVKE